jgi:hypothetical protein
MIDFIDVGEEAGGDAIPWQKELVVSYLEQLTGLSLLGGV